MSGSISGGHSPFDSVQPHDHVAFLCGRPEHWCNLASTFFREGLENNQRCLYLNGLYRPQQVYSLLVHESLPVGEARLGGRLAVKAATECFLTHGCLDIKSALSSLASEVDAALASGCSGLRLLVDMNWTTYFSGGLPELLACEGMLNELFMPFQPCLAVCHYERVLFPPKVLRLISAHHGSTLDGDRLLSLPAHAAQSYQPPRDRARMGAA